MRNFSSLLLEIEHYLQSSLDSENYLNNSNTNDLFSGKAGKFVKNIVLNRSDDEGDLFEDLQNTLWNVSHLLEEMGYSETFDRKLW